MHTTTPPPLSATCNGTVYLVLDDFGEFGRAYREADPTRADRQTVLADLLSGQYERPLRIVAFNPAEGWARDVSVEMAGEALAHAEEGGSDIPQWLRDFVGRAT
jgi:hypothetical protein